MLNVDLHKFKVITFLHNHLLGVGVASSPNFPPKTKLKIFLILYVLTVCLKCNLVHFALAYFAICVCFVCFIVLGGEVI